MAKMRHCRSTLESIRFANSIPMNKHIFDEEFQKHCLDGIITSKDVADEEMYRLTVERTSWQKQLGECPKRLYFMQWMAQYEVAADRAQGAISELDWALMGMRQARRVVCGCHQNFCFAVATGQDEVRKVVEKTSPTGLVKYVQNNTGCCTGLFNGDPVVTVSPLMIEIDLHVNSSARRRLINIVSAVNALGFQVTEENGETFLRQQSSLHDPSPSISNFADFTDRKIIIPR